MKLLERNKIRMILNENGVNTRGLSDDEMLSEHANIMRALGEPEAKAEALPNKPARKPAPKETTKPAPKAEPAPTLAAVPTANDADTAAQLAKLIASLRGEQQQAAPIDEQQIIELINKHATKRSVLEVVTAKDTVQIEGAHKSLETIITIMSADCMPYLAGPAGSGKTTLAIQAAEALSLDFYSTGAVMAPYELTGHHDANGVYTRTALRDAFEHGGVFLFDEIDACSAKALVSINQLLANDRFTFPDGVIEKHEDFRGMAAANTHGNGATREYVGRNPLDGASLDRFVMIDIEYDEQLELDCAFNSYAAHGGTNEPEAAAWVLHVQAVRAAAAKQGIKMIVSPRASIQGVKLLARGLSFFQAESMVIFKGASADAVRQIKAAL